MNAVSYVKVDRYLCLQFTQTYSYNTYTRIYSHPHTSHTDTRTYSSHTHTHTHTVVIHIHTHTVVIHIHAHPLGIHIHAVIPPFLLHTPAPISARSFLRRCSLPSVVALAVVAPSSSRSRSSSTCRPSTTGR